MSTARTDDRGPQEGSKGLVAFAWTLVGIPLVYGLYNTVKAASALFTG
ncbi:MFS transporter small subunit [Blastococcus capsensis]|nr:hypothetical protein [Blastococcus capsensis]MDK3255548.1 hypothetical protein [Blastococcus capsensis]